jgi:hypothetical protein
VEGRSQNTSALPTKIKTLSLKNQNRFLHKTTQGENWVGQKGNDYL